MPDTAMVIGSLYGPIDLRPYAAAVGRPCSILYDWQVGQEQAPQGFPKIYNRLITSAFSDPDVKYVWVCGDDIHPEPDSLLASQACLERDPTIGAIFPVEAWIEGNCRVTMVPFDGRRVPIESALVEGMYIEQIFAGFACACIRREAWEAVGPMSTRLGLAYCEDTDWGIRCWQSGFRVANYRGDYFLHDRGRTCNRLVQEGGMRAEEPYRAADALKAKWPFMWRDTPVQIMAMLKGWYEERASQRIKSP